MSHSDRKAMVSSTHDGLSINKQCQVLKISRSSFYYQPKAASEETLAIMNRMNELFMLYPFYGSRQMMISLQREGIPIGRHRVRRLMRIMGLQAIYRKPRTSDPHPKHKIYPYLLRNLATASEPCVVRRYYVYPDAKGLSVSGCGDGLGHAPCAGVALVKYDGG